jgi:hypothetical protein
MSEIKPPTYQDLLNRLDQFIRKWYLNQVIRGIILILSLLLGSWLLVATTAFYTYWPVWARAALFYGFIALNLYFLVRLVGQPLFKRMGWLKGIDRKQAAHLIGEHFPEVRDKLVNTLELSESARRSPGFSVDLMVASVEQRTRMLMPVPMLNMIDLKGNKKHLKILIPVAALFILVLIVAPSLLSKGGEKVVRYNKEFVREAPFKFDWINRDEQFEQSETALLRLRLRGSQVPAEAYVSHAGQWMRMQNTAEVGVFEVEIAQVKPGMKLQFRADEFSSLTYDLKVVARPIVERFEVDLVYPSYLGKTNQSLQNTGDLVVPEGTRITWKVQVRSVDSLFLGLGDGTEVSGEPSGSGRFTLVHSARREMRYSMRFRNRSNPRADSMAFTLKVLPDQWPVIEAGEQPDSLQSGTRYFDGEIGDDHGFSSLLFCYRVFDPLGVPQGELKVQPLSLGKGNRQRFFHYFDLTALGLRNGSYVDYYFEVSDNDGVNGAKKARTTTFQYRSLTEEQLEEKIATNVAQTTDQLEKSIAESQKIERDAEKLLRKLVDKKELSWEDKRLIEQIKQRQAEVQQQLRDAVSNMQENSELRSDEQKNDLLEKQAKLQEMANRLLNDEMRKMMEELEKMMDQQKSDKMREQLDKMKFDQSQVEKELDRMLEFFKEKEVEQKEDQLANKLEELARKQEELARKSEQSSREESESLKKEQESLNREFSEQEKKAKELEKENSELKNPIDFDELSEQSRDIGQEMEDAKQSLSEQKQKKAAGQQKSAAGKMKDMARKMREDIQSQEMQMLDENIESLRMLLENLVLYSFRQEKLMDQLQDNSTYSPVFVEMGQEQVRLKEDARLLEDSLTALAARVMQLESIVSREMGLINLNIEKALASFGDRRVAEIKGRQQYVMTSANNLALMLSELLNNLQQEKANNMDGQQQCKKPGMGGGSGRLSKMSQMQKALNEQMKQMRQQMGQQGAGKKDGQQGRNRQESQAFGEMVARQEAIRRELQRLNEELNKDGKGGLGDLNELAKEMEKTEKDLVNKRLTEESVRRQEEIMTRLLEAEKAEREREWDDERRANTAQQVSRREPPAFEAYKREKMRTLEMYRTVSPQLNPYYREKVDRYFSQIRP